MLLAALTSGLTNVAAFTVDELGHEYTGLAGLESEKVNLHDVGHAAGRQTDRRRGAVRGPAPAHDTHRHHREPVEEGAGGRRHGVRPHDDLLLPGQWRDTPLARHRVPVRGASGKNARLNIRGRYIRLSNYGDPGHKTLGNWYTTLLNVHGNPVKHYGEPDPGLARFGLDQTGAIKQFLS
ncbi:MAG: hypothetical protein U0791_07300 [Gemmataceae bacterium]